MGSSPSFGSPNVRSDIAYAAVYVNNRYARGPASLLYPRCQNQMVPS